MRKITDTDIVALLSTHPYSTKDLAALLGMNIGWISRRLTALVRSGAVTRTCPVKSDGRVPVYWVVRK